MSHTIMSTYRTTIKLIVFADCITVSCLTANNSNSHPDVYTIRRGYSQSVGESDTGHNNGERILLGLTFF